MTDPKSDATAAEASAADEAAAQAAAVEGAAMEALTVAERPVDPAAELPEEPVVEPAADSFAPPADPASTHVPPPPAAPVAPAPAGPHYLSIVAFTLGLVGVISPGLPSLAAIVLGHIGLSKEPTGRTFAIIGLVAGYVMVGLFVIGMIVFFSIWGVVLSTILSSIPFEGRIR